MRGKRQVQTARHARDGTQRIAPVQHERQTRCRTHPFAAHAAGEQHLLQIKRQVADSADAVEHNLCAELLRQRLACVCVVEHAGGGFAMHHPDPRGAREQCGGNLLERKRRAPRGPMYLHIQPGARGVAGQPFAELAVNQHQPCAARAQLLRDGIVGERAIASEELGAIGARERAQGGSAAREGCHHHFAAMRLQRHGERGLHEWMQLHRAWG